MSEQEIIETTPLGPDGPNQSEIDSLKEKHKNVKACFLGSKIYLVRMMSRREHLDFMAGLEDRIDNEDTDFDVDEMVAQKFTVWPSDIGWDNEPGGVVGLLSQEISKYSGFVKDKESIEL